jgi:hypothetical protein
LLIAKLEGDEKKIIERGAERRGGMELRKNGEVGLKKKALIGGRAYYL